MQTRMPETSLNILSQAEKVCYLTSMIHFPVLHNMIDCISNPLLDYKFITPMRRCEFSGIRWFLWGCELHFPVQGWISVPGRVAISFYNSTVKKLQRFSQNSVQKFLLQSHNITKTKKFVALKCSFWPLGFHDNKC